jgi:sigma-B regulation protein RsbU (phosphoserine phosphatase)
MRRLALVLLLCLEGAGFAQPPASPLADDASHPVCGIIVLDAPWRFHSGDNPQWASSTFDDSSWKLHLFEKSWAEQGSPGFSGYAWLRQRIKVPAVATPIALLVYPVGDSDEVYLDGVLNGTIGRMRPTPDLVANRQAEAIALPSGLEGHTVELALRTSVNPVTALAAGAGAAQPPILGTQSSVYAILQLARLRLAVSRDPLWALDIVSAVIGIISLGLFLLTPRSTEYAWAALFLIGNLLSDLFLYQFAVRQPIDQGLYIVLLLACSSITTTGWLLFIWRFLRSRSDWLLVAVLLANWLQPLAPLTVPPCSIEQAFLFGVACQGLMCLFILLKLLPSAIRNTREAQMLLVPFFLTTFLVGVEEAISGLHAGGLRQASISLVLYSGNGFNVHWVQLSTLLAYLAIGALLVFRFTRTAREQQRLSTEMASARAIQAQLVPSRLPSSHHLRCHAAYLAASEVGGDFYQILSQENNSSLIVVGDVSGKGLKAAMTGALAIGALRALAAEGLGPAMILSKLNRQLASASDGGFVTCLCARIDAGGALTLANAGHLAPYRNGEEVQLESGLPLGIVPEVTYAESYMRLAPGDRLTFLTDGVAEARNHRGELFGFDRTRNISTQSAEAIAGAAQAHGQEDDITVLTVTFSPAEVLLA